MTDHRSTRDVLDDHLALAADHDLETDLSRNFGDDVVLLTGYGIFRAMTIHYTVLPPDPAAM